MSTHTNALMEWAINKIKTEYPKDVALLIGVEGHCVNCDGHGECFDYFVPSTERGNELAQTFIVEGIGYDLYPRSWDRTERTANLEDISTLCLGNAKILYARSKEDEARFLSMREKLFSNLNNNQFVYQKALENLNIAMNLYQTMMFEDRNYQVKMAAGFIAKHLILAITFLNGTYEKDWTKGKISHLSQLSDHPDNFIEYYQEIINTSSQSEMKNLVQLLISTTRRFILRYKTDSKQIPGKIDFSSLAQWYEEGSLCWRRIYYYCNTNDCDSAFMNAYELQYELNIVKEEFQLKVDVDLLGYFNATDLNILSNRARELENYIISEINKNGVTIKNYKTLNDFLSAK